MRLLLTLAFMCRLVSSDMCVLCQPGKYQTSLSNRPCQDCEFNTFAPYAGMSACLACPRNEISAPGSSACECIQNYTRANSSDGCSLRCAPGQYAVGTKCQRAVVLKVEMALVLPTNASTSEVQQAILSSVSRAYQIAPEYLLVEAVVVPTAFRRRLAQTTSEVRYAFTIIAVFPANATEAEIAEVENRLKGMNSTTLNRALLDAPSGLRVSVLSIQLTDTSAPQTTPGATQTPSAPQTTPAAESTGGVNIAVIAGAAGGAGAVVMGLIACSIHRTRKPA